MFCTKCGTKLADDAKFCTACGQPTANPSNQNTTPAPAPVTPPPAPPAQAAAFTSTPETASSPTPQTTPPAFERMAVRYEPSEESSKHHRNRLLLLIGSGILGVILLLILGVVRWSEEAYIGINILLLGIGVAEFLAFKMFGGDWDGKTESTKKTGMIASVAVAAVLWLIMTIIGINHIISVFIFFFDIFYVYMLVETFKDIFKNIWDSTLTSDEIKAGDYVDNSRILLEGIHTDDSIASPIGRVYISNHTVLFVLINHMNGRIFVNPNGSIEIHQKKLFVDKYKQGYLNDTYLLDASERGANKIKEIIEKGCAEKNIPVPEMAYCNAIFLPNFERNNYIYDEYVYSSLPWQERISSYKKYSEKAARTTYFRAKTCFTLHDIGSIIKQCDSQMPYQNISIIEREETLDTIAKIIAEATGLVPVKPDPEVEQKYREAIAKKIAEHKAKNNQNNNSN